ARHLRGHRGSLGELVTTRSCRCDRNPGGQSPPAEGALHRLRRERSVQSALRCPPVRTTAERARHCASLRGVPQQPFRYRSYQQLAAQLWRRIHFVEAAPVLTKLMDVELGRRESAPLLLSFPRAAMAVTACRPFRSTRTGTRTGPGHPCFASPRDRLCANR